MAFRSIVLALLTMLSYASSARATGPDEALALDALLRAATVPGVAIGVVRGGEVRAIHVAGRRDGEGRNVDENTVFEAASLSKPIVAWLTLKLAEAGEFDLDAPLWAMVQPERLAHDERARRITARMVLSHRTGLPNWGGTPLELNADPGERWGYSGEGFVFLQQALEARFGQPLEVLARAQVFEPLAMARSAFVWRSDFDVNYAVGHDLAGAPQPKGRPSTANAAASLHTTAGDYARFLAAVLAGEGLAAETVGAMLAPAAQVEGWGTEAAAAPLRWGLGWGLQPAGEGWSIWHWGDNGAFRCFVVGDPRTGDGVVYFTNSENGLGIARALIGRFLPLPLAAVAWLDYTPHDDPRQQARIRARQVFVADGLEAGLALLAAFETAHAEPIPDAEIVALASYLGGRGLEDRALGLLEARSGAVPSEPVLRALAEAQVSARRYETALATYRMLGALDGVDASQLQPRIAWLEEGLSASTSPSGPDLASLQAIAGRYGPRRVEFDAGRLYYLRDGATARTALVPLGADLFALASSATFRLRVERDDTGAPVALIGRYADGRSDVSPRDP